MVESADVQIHGLAIGGDGVGLVAKKSTDLVVTNDWFGFRLNSQPSGSLTTGVLLGPGSDGATIGREDLSLGGPDVIGNSEVGIYVDGASDATIQANKIGVALDGVTKAPVEVGIRIVDSAGSEPDEAEDVEVGGALTPTQVAAAGCIGPCNVIAATVTGIDLTGTRRRSRTGRRPDHDRRQLPRPRSGRADPRGRTRRARSRHLRRPRRRRWPGQWAAERDHRRTTAGKGTSSTAARSACSRKVPKGSD